MKLWLVVSLCCFSFIAKSQWLQKKNEAYVKVGVWFVEADEHYTSTGKKDPNATRGFFNTHLYVKYGLTSKVNLVTYVPFYSRTYQNRRVSIHTGEILTKGASENSLGDINLGVEMFLGKINTWSFSTSLTLGLPTGEDAGGNDGSYQTGDGEFNQLLKLHSGVSYAIGKQRLYSKISAGFNNRTEGFSDEWSINTEIGTGLLSKKLWIIGRLGTLQSLHNGELNATNNEGSIFANNVEYTNIGGGIIYKLTESISLSGSYTSTLSGKIIYAAPAWSGGVSMQF